MKRLPFCLTVALALAVVIPWTYVRAAPPGDSRDSDVGKKLYNFNILAVPQDNWSVNDTTCTNSGHRIFFQRTNSGSIGSILWSLDPNAPQNFKITDCDGTADGTAAVLVNEELELWVMIRLLGKKTDTLGLVCSDIIDVGVDDLCLLDGVKLNIPRGKDFTKIWFNVFDDGFEQLLWELDTATGFRIAQVWIFEKL